MKIDRVRVKNFKSLKDIDVKLSNLTLITGVNSSGKSSFIQSLLFFKQNIQNINKTQGLSNFILGILSQIENNEELTECIEKILKFVDDEELIKNVKEFVFEKNSEPDKFIKKIVDSVFKADLNGKYLNLGNTDLLLSHNVVDENIVFELSHKTEKLKIEVNPESEIICNENFKPDILKTFENNNFGYLATNRSPPALTFPFSKDINNNSIGVNGEYTAHHLAEHRRKKLDIMELQHPNSQTLQLLENTYKWLGEISSGVSILASSDASTQSVKLTYQYEYGDNTTSNYSSLNVGFGLTYVLPVIVLILKSKPGDLVIIENPESHLHPAGQSKIAELCAIAANNGVQIIVETHSDHFLNGVRVATKQKTISPEQSKIYYFKKDKNELETKIDEIDIDENGGISDYPKGFFDQFDDDLDKLVVW